MMKQITKLGLILMLGSTISACSSTMRWKEEVKLHGGQVIVSERYYNLGGYAYLDSSERTALNATVTFNLPGTDKKIIWKNDFSDKVPEQEHLRKKPMDITLLKSEVRLIAAYYGVVVAFAANHSKQHSPPFVVALCEGAETRIDIVTNKVIFGQIPHHKQILVNAWIEIHREELIASWNAGRMTGEYFKLDPLR